MSTASSWRRRHELMVTATLTAFAVVCGLAELIDVIRGGRGDARSSRRSYPVDA